MPFLPFELERWQSRWEHEVRHNLSESGVHPLAVHELLRLTDTDPATLKALRLGYSQTNGTAELRQAIAELYPGATSENVLVTVGSSEANFVACWTLLSPGDRVAVQLPTYMQTWGLAKNFGARVSPFRLTWDQAWTMDLQQTRAAIQPDTRLVVVTNPNNPTGHILSPQSRRVLTDCVQDAGAWLLVDEVYRGAERDGNATASFWNATQQTIVTGGVSKAYGLPGLRIGWIVAPDVFIEAALQRHDYTVIGPSAISDFLAIRALGAGDVILQRTRDILNRNYEMLDRWLAGFGDLFRWSAPEAGAICFVKYNLALSALALVEHLRTHHSTLLVPGDHFDTPQYLRFGYGGESAELSAALDATAHGLRDLISD